MNLFRNIIGAFMALFFLGVAAPAFARTNAETVACRDAGFAASPFSGTTAHKERQARSLDIGTEVLVDGITVPLAAGESLWSRCEGPSLTEQLATANARIASLERQNSRLTAASTSLKDTLAATKAELAAAQTETRSQESFGQLWLILGLLAMAFLFFMIWWFSRVWDDRARLLRRIDAIKSAPAEDEPSMESTLGKINDGPTPTGSEPDDSDERPPYM